MNLLPRKNVLALCPSEALEGWTGLWNKERFVPTLSRYRPPRQKKRRKTGRNQSTGVG